MIRAHASSLLIEIERSIGYLNKGALCGFHGRLIFYWLAAFVFMSFSDTESVFLDVALLLEILQGSPFYLITI